MKMAPSKPGMKPLPPEEDLLYFTVVVFSTVLPAESVTRTTIVFVPLLSVTVADQAVVPVAVIQAPPLT
jgi:hypothetical protein